MSREEKRHKKVWWGIGGKKKQLLWMFLLVSSEPQSQDSSLYPHKSVFYHEERGSRFL